MLQNRECSPLTRPHVSLYRPNGTNEHTKAIKWCNIKGTENDKGGGGMCGGPSDWHNTSQSSQVIYHHEKVIFSPKSSW